ncbi:hypothetical protein [Chryseobacterium sp. T1]
MAIQDWLTQFWVKNWGQNIDPKTHDWLIGPIGNTDVIKNKFVKTLAKEQNLSIQENLPDVGLLESLESIGINNNDGLNKKVEDFYLHTSNYNLDVKANWHPLFLPFGFVLQLLFSNRLQQLNLPIKKSDLSDGIESKIIKLQSNETKQNIWTIWYRIAKKSQNVIFSGIYTQCKNPNYEEPLFKLIFPLPNGNASVIMTKEILADGSLILKSEGKKFGDSGFYFTLTNHKGQYWSKFVRSMHEELKVYETSSDELRAKHQFRIWGIQFLTLNYSIEKKFS